MSPASPTVERENNIAEMHSLIARDLAASNEVAKRITQLRQDIADEKPQPSKKFDLLERSNKDMTKELVLRVERIESDPVGTLKAADREMLQALNSRLAVCDLQAMRLAELRDLEFTAKNTKERAYLDAEVNEGSSVAGQEPEEELSIGRASKHSVGEIDSNTKKTEHQNDVPHDVSESSEEDAISEDWEELAVDKSAWPLLYRIMNVDPSTSAADIQPLVHGSYRRLALKYSPQYFPNDPSVPALWEIITKAYNVLVDSDRRLFYDAHEKVPAGLEDFDVALLHRE